MSHRHDENLTALLGALRHAQSTDGAPPYVETAVMRAWDASRAPRATQRRRIAARLASLAAVGVVAVGLTALGGFLRSEMAVAPSRGVTSPTVILVGEPIRDDEQVRLIRVRLPVSALHALGVRSTASPFEDVDVDLVVGEDGVARALNLNP